MMQSILTKSGAVIYVDSGSRLQSRMLHVAITAFGGLVGEPVEAIADSDSGES